MIRSPRFIVSVSSTPSDPLATVISTASTVSAMPSQLPRPRRSPNSSAEATETKIGAAAPRMPALSAVVYCRPQYQSVVLVTRPVPPRIAKAT